MEETLKIFSTDTILSLSFNVLIAVIVLILTIILSKVAKSWIKRLGLSYNNLDDTLFIFLSNIASIIIQVFGLILYLEETLKTFILLKVQMYKMEVFYTPIQVVH
mgnify:CR=1 FL=1